ncbi:hypothetical protein QBC45DRAFT_148622 [Copromyces sp. CBS 386.78]|nr:hypothetical protein QBC45DRAFT_148622 [Copromyces sp. CBS 386.78]
MSGQPCPEPPPSSAVTLTSGWPPPVGSLRPRWYGLEATLCLCQPSARSSYSLFSFPASPPQPSRILHSQDPNSISPRNNQSFTMSDDDSQAQANLIWETIRRGDLPPGQEGDNPWPDVNMAALSSLTKDLLVAPAALPIPAYPLKTSNNPSHLNERHDGKKQLLSKVYVNLIAGPVPPDALQGVKYDESSEVFARMGLVDSKHLVFVE